MAINPDHNGWQHAGTSLDPHFQHNGTFNDPSARSATNGHAQVGTFGLHAPLLLKNGYSPVPIQPGQKRPLSEIGDWNRLRVTPLTDDEIAAIATEHPDAGLGVVGGYGGLVPCDIDTDNMDIRTAIDTVLGEPLVGKRGRRGVTVFGRDPSGLIKPRKFRMTDGTMIMEVLITGQVVVPPTIHPESQRPYWWLTDCTLSDVRIDDLPVWPPDLIERLEHALAPWLPPPREYNRPAKSNGTTAPASPKRMRTYAEAALEGERQKLGGMPSKSGRNWGLFIAGCKLGKYVHHGVLSLAELEGPLLEACKGNGLITEDGLKACKDTLASGLRKAEGDDLTMLEDRAATGSDAHAGDANAKKAGIENPNKKGGGRPTQTDRLIEIATGKSVELYHTPDGMAYADIDVNGHRETWRLKSAGFRGWLRRQFYLETDGAPNAEAMSTAMGVIEARARFDGVERIVHLRVAEHGNKLYLDLCNAVWSAVEVDDNGWRIVKKPAVRFRRTPGMLPLPDPASGGSLDELRKHLHVEDNGYVLAVSWLLASLRPRGPYPILTLTGEQGTGKSFTARNLRSLIDPHTASLRSLPRDTRDLYVVAMNGHVLVFDNLSSMSAEISDCLCRLSTGGGFSTRALYTDNDEVIFDGQRPIALTSITDVANRSDLADRLVIVRLEMISDKERRPEEELLAAFEAARPRILGGLLDAVSHGLMQLPHTRLNRLPRMADYAVWVRACETAIWQAGMHMAAYEENRADAVDIVLDADPVAMALRQHMQYQSETTTTATDLYAALGALVRDPVHRGRNWPSSAKGLSGQLTRLGPALRRVGITITYKRQGHTGVRLIHITREASASRHP